jgi:anti-sigma factor RsiW
MDDTRRAEIEQVIADCDASAPDTAEITLRDAGAALRELLAAYDGALAELRASGDDAAPV